MNTIKSVGQKLKELRASKNTIDKNGNTKKYTQNDLCNDTGISIQSIRAYEINKTIPESKNAKILANFFKVTVESLINDSLDITYLSSIQETDYSKELGLSNKSIQNIKGVRDLSKSQNIFIESKYYIEFIKKMDLLLNLNNTILKETKKLIKLLSIKDKKNKQISDKEYIKLVCNTIEDIEKKFEEMQEIKEYIIFEQFYDNFEIAKISLIESNIEEDFDFWCSNLYKIASNLLTNIINAEKILKYEMTNNFNSFITEIIRR